MKTGQKVTSNSVYHNEVNIHFKLLLWYNIACEYSSDELNIVFLVGCVSGGDRMKQMNLV